VKRTTPTGGGLGRGAGASFSFSAWISSCQSHCDHFFPPPPINQIRGTISRGELEGRSLNSTPPGRGFQHFFRTKPPLLLQPAGPPLAPPRARRTKVRKRTGKKDVSTEPSSANEAGRPNTGSQRQIARNATENDTRCPLPWRKSIGRKGDNGHPSVSSLAATDAPIPSRQPPARNSPEIGLFSRPPRLSDGLAQVDQLMMMPVFRGILPRRRQCSDPDGDALKSPARRTRACRIWGTG